MPTVSDLVGFEVDTVLLESRMRNMRASMRDLTVVYREAVKPVFAAYKNVLPRGPSGEMRRDAYKQATFRFGSVGLHNTGSMANRSSHSAVNEFGGTIPVPHSRTNPRLRGKRRLLDKDKPWIGGKGGTSYYLYPMWDRTWETIVPPFVKRLKELCRRYMPNTSVR